MVQLKWGQCREQPRAQGTIWSGHLEAMALGKTQGKLPTNIKLFAIIIETISSPEATNKSQQHHTWEPHTARRVMNCEIRGTAQQVSVPQAEPSEPTTRIWALQNTGGKETVSQFFQHTMVQGHK